MLLNPPTHYEYANKCGREESKNCFCRPFFFPMWLPLTLVVLSFAMDEEVRANLREMKQGYMIRSAQSQMRLSLSHGQMCMQPLFQQEQQQWAQLRDIGPVRIPPLPLHCVIVGCRFIQSLGFVMTRVLFNLEG